MKILGVDFTPMDESLQQRLETLAVAGWFMSVTLAGYTFLLIGIYLLFTSFWWLTASYAVWIYLDRNTCKRGGRCVEWVQKWACWTYMRCYFSANLKLDSNFKLDATKNYLFCCFPHGVIPAGPFSNIASYGSDFHRFYPKFKVKTASLLQLYYLPIVREIGLAIGGISCSAKSLCYILSKPEGGYIVNLSPGGAAEAVFAQSGRYKLVLKNRKGFVKVALKTGASLVPVITFGENELFNQINGPVISEIQKIVKKYFGFAPILCVGRGFFQNSFGLIPRRKVLTTVVGAPIDVQKSETPTSQEVNKLHQVFIQELVALFERFKYECLEKPDAIRLEFE